MMTMMTRAAATAAAAAAAASITPHTRFNLRTNRSLYTTLLDRKSGKRSPYSITERRVPELIPVLGSQSAGDGVINPAVGCHYFPPDPQFNVRLKAGISLLNLPHETKNKKVGKKFLKK